MPVGVHEPGKPFRYRRIGRFSGGAGFTLVEVLVVITIVGLLAALLLPSLARSRENTRKVLCTINLKEWGRGMLMYVQANRGYLPYEDRGEEAVGRVCWFDAMDRAFGSLNAGDDVKVCPTVRRSDPDRPESYRINSKLAETNPESEFHMPWRRLDTLPRPIQTVLLFDGDVGGDRISFKGRWRMTDDDVNYRHNVAANILFADGHVESLHRKAVQLRSVNNEPIIWQPKDMGPWNPKPVAN